MPESEWEKMLKELLKSTQKQIIEVKKSKYDMINILQRS